MSRTETVPASTGADNLAPDTKLRNDLNNGEFHYYSVLLSVDTTANANTPVASGDATITVSTHRVTVEWTRYRTQTLPDGYNVLSRPIINGLDIGIAIRLVFDIQLRQKDANVAANFGFGQIVASIASREAQVQAHFEQRGTVFSFVPEQLITISSVEDFIKALNTFYKCFTYMSSAWDAYVDGGANAPVTAPMSDDVPSTSDSDPTQVTRATIVPVTVPSKANIFAPTVIAYHVNGLPNSASRFNAAYAAGYVYGVRQISKKVSCADTWRSLNERDTGYRKGVMRAYQEITASSLCGGTAISDAQATFAQQAVSNL